MWEYAKVQVSCPGASKVQCDLSRLTRRALPIPSTSKRCLSSGFRVIRVSNMTATLIAVPVRVYLGCMAGTPSRTTLALFTLVAALLVAPAAQAGTASVEGGTVVYRDDPGAARTITWARDGSSIAINETPRGLSQKVVGTAGPGCTVTQSNDFNATYVCDAP